VSCETPFQKAFVKSVKQTQPYPENNQMTSQRQQHTSQRVRFLVPTEKLQRRSRPGILKVHLNTPGLLTIDFWILSISFQNKRCIVQWNPIITRWSGSKKHDREIEMISYGETTNDIIIHKWVQLVLTVSLIVKSFCSTRLGALMLEIFMDRKYRR